MRDLFSIFRFRWPEVTLVVVFQAGLMLLLESAVRSGGIESPESGSIPVWALIVLGVGCGVLAVVWQMLFLGLLRTAALDPVHPQEPLTLLQTGRPFFWRILMVQFLLGVMVWVVAGLVAALLGEMIGIRQGQEFPQWILEIAAFSAGVLLVKPIFLIPAQMVALNKSASEAFNTMRQIRLTGMGLLLTLYVAGLAVVGAVGIGLAFITSREGIVYYVAASGAYLVQGMIMLTLMLATVLSVAVEARPAEEETA